MDFITGLPVTPRGHDAILTFVDHLTKTAHFVPTRSTIDASGSAELYIDHVFRLHGLTKVLVCDRDPRFTSEVFRQVFRILGVRLNFSTSNHPQTDGMTERVHRVIGQMLRSTVNHRQNNWDEVLPMCEFAYNDLLQSSTSDTPFFLSYGFHPLSPADFLVTTGALGGVPLLRDRLVALKEARDNIIAAQARQCINADSHRVEPMVYKAGDLVMVHRNYISSSVSRDQPCSKLRQRWFGPFEILSVLSDTTVKLKLPQSYRVHNVFNTSALKLYHRDTSPGRRPPPPPPVIDADGNERYIVEKVVSDRRYRGNSQYLVKWQGYIDPTWEPMDNLLNEAGQQLDPLKLYLQSTNGSSRGVV